MVFTPVTAQSAEMYLVLSWRSFLMEVRQRGPFLLEQRAAEADVLCG